MNDDDDVDEDALLNACVAYDQQLTSGNMLDEESDITLVQACESYEQQLTSEPTDIRLDGENCWMNDDVDEDILLNACIAYDKQLTSGNIDDNDPDVEHNNRQQENDVDDNALATAAAGEIQRQLGRNTMLIYHWLH